MSLKLEKPEKIRISFKCYLYSNKKKFLESPRHANGYQYAKIYLFHAFHDHFTFLINWKGMSYFIQSHGKYFKPIITACYQCAMIITKHVDALAKCDSLFDKLAIFCGETLCWKVES